MTRAEKRAKATPILKSEILAGSTLAEAAKKANISVNTAARYRVMAEEAEGKPWMLQMDEAIADGDAPKLSELAELLARRLKVLAKRPITAGMDTQEIVSDSDSIVKLNGALGSLKREIRAAQDAANDPEALLRGLDAFAQWLRREISEGRVTEPTLEEFRELYERYTDDLAKGRFVVEVNP